MSKYFVVGFFRTKRLSIFLQKLFPWLPVGLLDIDIDEDDRRVSSDVDSYDEAKKLATEFSKLCEEVTISERFTPDEGSDQPTPPAENTSEDKPMKWLPPVGSPEYEALKKENKKTDAEMQTLLARPISDLGLSVKVCKCLMRLGINTFGDLCGKSGNDLAEGGILSASSRNVIRKKLAAFSLKLNGDD